MTETPEQLRARRKKDRAITRKAEALKTELAVIGAVAVEAQRNPTAFNQKAARDSIAAFIEKVAK